MYQHRRLTTSSFNFFQKFKNFDYILLVCILLLGFISLATMYSTDGGKVLFHTKSHFTKLVIFTFMMLFISFINIKYWFALGYLCYLVVIGLLIWTYLFGITSSGSQRWIDLYFINLQPSELMKIFIILCLAKYFHRMKIENVNSIYTILTSLIIIILPMGLVIVQPDLGTSLLIAISGIAGPGGGSAERPVGTVCLAWKLNKDLEKQETFLFEGNRNEVRYQTVVKALEEAIVLMN